MCSNGGQCGGCGSLRLYVLAGRFHDALHLDRLPLYRVIFLLFAIVSTEVLH